MCTKCGSTQPVIGPVYGRNSYSEWLTYRCPDCGYSYRTATAEESKSDAVRIAWANEMRRQSCAKPK